MNLRDFYDRDYHRRVHRGMIEVDDYYFARAQAFKQMYFSGYPETASVLDFGCGLGQATALLKNAFAYDASVEAREFARNKGIRIYNDIEDIPLNHFDVVFCRHALEHTPNPLEVLQLLAKYVKKDGELFLILPREHHRKAGFSPDLNMHLYCWNFRSINNLLSIAGFAPFHNSVMYNLGFRKLLWIKKIVGFKIYLLLTQAIGRFYDNGELIIKARLA